MTKKSGTTQKRVYDKDNRDDTEKGLRQRKAGQHRKGSTTKKSGTTQKRVYDKEKRDDTEKRPASTKKKKIQDCNCKSFVYRYFRLLVRFRQPHPLHTLGQGDDHHHHPGLGPSLPDLLPG